MRFGNRNEGEPVDLQEKARALVCHNYNVFGIGTPRGNVIERLEMDDVYVVWFSKTLQNWKALVSTTRPDDRYYEVTYDGNLGQAYVDTYVKTHNTTISD